jgi:hypothetical protein
MTALGSSMREASMSAGADAFLEKPIDPRIWSGFWRDCEWRDGGFVPVGGNAYLLIVRVRIREYDLPDALGALQVSFVASEACIEDEGIHDSRDFDITRCQSLTEIFASARDVVLEPGEFPQLDKRLRERAGERYVGNEHGREISSGFGQTPEIPEEQASRHTRFGLLLGSDIVDLENALEIAQRVLRSPQLHVGKTSSDERYVTTVWRGFLQCQDLRPVPNRVVVRTAACENVGPIVERACSCFIGDSRARDHVAPVREGLDFILNYVVQDPAVVEFEAAMGHGVPEPRGPLQTVDSLRPSRPTLIIVDYVASRVASVSAMVLELCRSQAQLPFPVRVLLAEREQGSWWSQLLREESQSEYAELIACQYGDPLRLGHLAREALMTLAAEVAHRNRIPWNATRAQAFELRMRTLDPLGLPLFGMMAAASRRLLPAPAGPASIHHKNRRSE